MSQIDEHANFQRKVELSDDKKFELVVIHLKMQYYGEYAKGLLNVVLEGHYTDADERIRWQDYTGLLREDPLRAIVQDFNVQFSDSRGTVSGDKYEIRHLFRELRDTLEDDEVTNELINNIL